MPDLPRMAFDQDAANYDAARPGYPEALYALLAQRCGIARGMRALEIGPGTGQATARLLDAGANVVAVEPGARLASVLAQRFAGPSLHVVVGDFETASLTGLFDVCVAATSFHWLDLEVSLPKLAGLLRPGGWLAIFWNVFQDPAKPTAFREALDSVYNEILPDLKMPSRTFPDRLRPESWTRDLEAGGYFGPVETHFLTWDNPLTADQARKLWATFSNIMALDEARRTLFLDRLASIVDEQFGGLVYDPCVTAAYLAPVKSPVPATG